MGKGSKKELSEDLFIREAKKASRQLKNKLEDNFFLDIESRGVWLARAIGRVEGYLAARSGKETLLESSIFLVNMFDQADTGGAIANKPGGMELLATVDLLRKALNQNGKLTILDSKQIKEILRDRPL
ncbi:MAG TPA: hypothetical protein P5080_02340 [Candidatus Paceibacterota bacterium]|nr:hypothetical protein [Candidatus Pacearchaeota archaeon]HRZ50808.1 hypothetical protein [Candidatus Paceibacterota bacterium]HSA36529.1 hypothetical protein [Candidatus Paceibacterota bacterium]